MYIELHMSYVDSILSVPNIQWFPPAHCLGACGGVEKFMRKAATSVEGGPNRGSRINSFAITEEYEVLRIGRLDAVFRRN